MFQRITILGKYATPDRNFNDLNTPDANLRFLPEIIEPPENITESVDRLVVIACKVSKNAKSEWLKGWMLFY